MLRGQQKKEMKNTQHGTCPGSSSMMEEVYNKFQILSTFCTDPRYASGARGSMYKKKEGEIVRIN
jgi:hypothetical protein